MQTNKTIRIFLSSAIDELKDERDILSDYIFNTISPIFSKNGIEIELFKMDDIDWGYAGKPSQNAVDDYIKKCDICIFIFKQKINNETIHEYNKAHELQNTKKQSIFVYYFDESEDKKSHDLTAFLNQLKEDRNRIYWTVCKDIDTMKSHFLFSLLKKLYGESDVTNVKNNDAQQNDVCFVKFRKSGDKHIKSTNINQDIDNILNQITDTIENSDNNIAIKITKILELYKKADKLASTHDYDKEKYLDLLLDYAKFLYKYGLYNDSKNVLLRHISLAENIYGTASEKTAASYNEIGLVYYVEGDFDKALEYYIKTWEIYKKILGTKHLEIVKLFNNIGLIYYEKFDYNKALGFFSKALAINEKLQNTNHLDTANSFNNIGLVYYKLGHYNKALDYFYKVMSIKEKSQDTNHSEIADSFNNIGLVYYKQGHYNKAMKCFSKALEIRKEILGIFHTDIAASYDNIGLLYYKQKDFAKALKYFVKALEIREKIMNKPHPDIAFSYNNIGMVCYHLMNYFNALEYFFRALAIYKEIFGKDYPIIANIYKFIGLIYYNQGEFIKSKDFLNKALNLLNVRNVTTSTDIQDIQDTLAKVDRMIN